MRTIIILLMLIIISLFFYNCKAQKAIPTQLEKETITKQLDSMADLDQKYNMMIVNFSKNRKEGEEIDMNRLNEIENEKKNIYKNNCEVCVKLLDKYGFIDNETFSARASSKFWLIIQHCDHDVKLQKRALKLMKKKINEGTIDLVNYAYLHDRVSKNTGKKYQLYGTQVIRDKNGKYMNFPKIKDSVNTAILRKKLNMGSLEEYFKIMNNL